MKSILKESNISLNYTHESILHQTRPWSFKKPEVIFELNELPKTKNIPLLIRRNFSTSSNTIPNTYVFPGGPKFNDKTARAAVLNKTIISTAISTESSIFTAEGRTIDLALHIILKSKYKKFIIFSDSLLVLLSLSNKK